jgi:hypothetical protein
MFDRDLLAIEPKHRSEYLARDWQSGAGAHQRSFKGRALLQQPPDSTVAYIEAQARGTGSVLKVALVTFSTESDWRTLEVPFEFRDLPLPPR